MADERIEVEWIATATKMTQVLTRLEKRLDKQEKQLSQIGKTSKKAADGAASSFNKLERELRDNEAALKRLSPATAAFAAQKRKVDALRASLAKVRAQMGGIGAQANGAMTAGIAKMTQLVAGMASFQTIVSAVVAELEKVKQLKLDASATTKTLEEALADIGQNIGAGAMPEAKRMIIDQSSALGTTQQGLGNLLGTAVSAGAKDLKEAMAISAAALKLTVGDAAKAQALVGGTLDVATRSQTDNYAGALGQMLQVQSQVRSTNMPEFVKNFGPALATATMDGVNVKAVSTERAFEVGAVISQIIKDQTGANTATATRQFFTRMDSFAPELKKKLADGTEATVDKATMAAFRGATTFDQRVDMMRKNEGLRQQFLATQEESRGKVAIRAIVGGEKTAMELEQKAQGAIHGIPQAAKFYEDLAKMTKEQTLNLRTARKSESALATGRVLDVDRTTAGTVLGVLENTLDNVDLSGSDWEARKKIRGMIFDQVGGSGVEAIDAGISQLQEAKQRRRIFGFIPAGGEVSQLDKGKIDVQIKLLQDMKTLLQQQVDNKPKPPAMRPKQAPLPAANVP